MQHVQHPTFHLGVRRNWLGWGLVILVPTVLAFTLDLKEVSATLARVKPLELGAILLLMTLDRLVMAWKWSMLLRAIGVNLRLMTITRFCYQGTLSGISSRVKSAATRCGRTGYRKRPAARTRWSLPW